MSSHAHQGKPHKRPHAKPKRAKAVQDIVKSGPLRALAIAAAALVLAAVAVVLFAVLQAVVPCEFRPVTYAIFTGIVLACLGIILGGQAGIRGKLPNTGIAWTVSGGAAFLVIVMAAVWWATRSECKEVAALKLSFVPTRHAVAAAGPPQAVRHVMVRFDERVTVRQFARGDHTDYDIYLSENQTGFKIYLDIIAQDKAVQVCEISLQPAPPSIKSLLAQPDKFIPVGSHTENEPIEVKFKNGFLDELHSSFDARSKGGVNVCIQIDYFDSEGKTRTALVDDVYFVEAAVSLSDIWTRFGAAAQPARPFRVYARTGAAQPPTLVSERPPEPPLDPPAAVPALAPPSRGSACPERPPQVKAALTTIMTTGVIGDDDLKAVYENWCNVEEEFYKLVRIRADSNSIRYNLVRFIRSAVTKIDICWASSDLYRKRNADRIACVPKLDQPRNLARSLPFAATPDQKRAILDLLLADSAPGGRSCDRIRTTSMMDCLRTISPTSTSISWMFA